MAKIPQNKTESQTAKLIYKHYEETAQEQAPRKHLGASVIGHKCKRAVWYAFRWCNAHTTGPKFKGRILRLFEHGDIEEERIVQNLRDIGVDIAVTASEYEGKTGKKPLRRNGEQGKKAQIAYRALGNHFGGSTDGVVLGGVPEAPVVWHIFEAKTANKSNFAAAKKYGIEKKFPKYYAQVQVYMHLEAVTRCLFVMVCKDNDEIYVERIEYNQSKAIEILGIAEEIILSPAPPKQISTKPDYYVCRFCDYNAVCHSRALPKRSCRTCTHSTPYIDTEELEQRLGPDDVNRMQRMSKGDPDRGVPGEGIWTCDRHPENPVIIHDAGLAESGCGWHLYPPPLMGEHLKMSGACNAEPPTYISYVSDDGIEYRNIVSPVRPIVRDSEGNARLDLMLVDRDMERAVIDGGLSAEAFQLVIADLAEEGHGSPKRLLEKCWERAEQSGSYGGSYEG